MTSVLPRVGYFGTLTCLILSFTGLSMGVKQEDLTPEHLFRPDGNIMRIKDGMAKCIPIPEGSYRCGTAPKHCDGSASEGPMKDQKMCLDSKNIKCLAKGKNIACFCKEDNYSNTATFAVVSLLQACDKDWYTKWYEVKKTLPRSPAPQPPQPAEAPAA